MIVLITSQFPFGAGEHFIEGELPLWHADDELVILPEKRGGTATPRSVPSAIHVETLLADRWESRRCQARALVEALGSKVLRDELRVLRTTKRWSAQRVKWAVRATAQVMLVRRALRDLSVREGRPIDVVYGYWMTAGVMAGAMLRSEGVVRHSLSRAHRYDLWEDTRPGQYMPLIRQFAPEINGVYTVSEKGREHLRRYGFRDEQRRLARLGVLLPDELTPSSGDGEFHVVTLSSIIPVKRLELAAEAVAELARRRPGLQVRWTHIGDGTGRAELERVVQEIARANLTVDLRGQMDHDDVLDWLGETPVDMMLNTSSSEGIPVSLMEAMAHGIPAVATNVGGVSELVSSTLLLDPDVSGAGIADLLDEYLDDLKGPELRWQARTKIDADYDMLKNHRAFIDDIRALR